MVIMALDEDVEENVEPLKRACHEAYLVLVVCIGALDEICSEMVLDLTLPNGFEEYSKNCEALRLAQDNLWTLAEDLVDNLAINGSALQEESTGILVADNCIRRAYNTCASMLLKRYDLLIKRAADSEPGSPNETFFKRSALGILKLTYGFT